MQITDKGLQQYVQEKLTVIQDQNLKTVLDLKPGDIVDARLLQHNGKEAVMEIAGKRINAELQLAGQQLPAPGSELKVQVAIAEESKLVLKLLDGPTLPANASQLSQEEPLALLLRLGLPVNSRNQLAVETMLAYRVPVTEENITLLLNASAQSGTNLVESLETNAFLLSRNLPLQPELGIILDRIMHQGQQLQHLVEDAAAAQTQQLMQADNDVSPAATVERLIARLMVSVEGQDTVLAEQIRNFVQELKFGDSAAGAKKLLTILQEIEDLPQGHAGNELAAADGQSKIYQLAGDILSHLTVQQLSNKQDAPLPYLYFQLPCNFNGQRLPGEVFIFTRPRPHRQRIDPNDLRVIFCLDTPGLGMVKVDLHIKMRNLALRVGVTDEAIAGYVNKHIFGLVNRLEQLRYCVTGADCFVDEQTPFAYVQTEVMQNFAHIDLRV